MKAPKLDEEPLEPVEIEDIRSMLDTCDKSFLGKRNRAILLFLLDTGLRARELLSIELLDINLVTGNVLLRRGKGGKPRTVFIGKETKKALRAYLRERKDSLSTLWVADDQRKRLAYGGLRTRMALGRGFVVISLLPSTFGWWNTASCFGHAGGFSSLAFGDYRTGIAAATVANGNRGMNDVLRRFLPLAGGLRNAA